MMKEKIREKVLSYGADVCGFAGIERFTDAPQGFHPRDIFPECQSIVTFGKALPKGLYKVNSRLIYGHFNTFACPEVDHLAYQTASLLEREYSGTAVPMPSDVPYDYWDGDNLEGRGLLSMKHIAQLSGIGTLGKNTLLLHKDYGNRLVIGCVLTDLRIEPDELSVELCLERCDLCIKSCPVGAISDKGVHQKQCRMYSYGKTKRGFETVECNQCRRVCPMGLGLS